MHKENYLSQPEPQIFHRMSPSVYAALEKSLPKPAAPSNPIEAGYLLGVQAVLKVLRDGYSE